MKSDFSIFVTKLFGKLLVYGGFLLAGSYSLFSGRIDFMTAIFVFIGIIGLYLEFKAKRRTGYIIYRGGRI